jgi:tetratricopeptide (TPR) repeat protein
MTRHAKSPEARPANDPATSAGQGIEAPQVGPRRKLAWTLLWAGLICLLLAGGVATFWYYRSGPPPPAIAAAIQQARAAINQSPRSAVAWGKYGMVLQAHRFAPEAESCYLRAEELNPRDVRWPYYLGLLLSTHDPQASISQLQRAVELADDQDETPRLQLANALLSAGRYEEAEQQFRMLLGGRRAEPVAYLGLARVASEQGGLQETLQYLEHCGGSVYTRKAAHTLLSTVYQRLNNSKEVDRELRIARSLPEDAGWRNPYLVEIGRLVADKRMRLANAMQFLAQHHDSEDIDRLRELAREYPEWHMAWLALGQVMLQHGDYTGADRALQQARKLNPDVADIQFNLGCARYSLGDRETAYHCFHKAIELRPEHALAYVNLSHCLRERGDPEGAANALRTALRYKPDLGLAHMKLGELLAQTNQEEEALQHLQQAIALLPTDKKARELFEKVKLSADNAKKHRPP